MNYRVVVSKSIRDDLNELPTGERRFFELFLKRLAEKSVTNIQKNKLSGQVLNIRSGDLRAKTFYRIINSFNVDIDNAAKYAAIHELGGDIYPKRAKYLRFPVAGGWVTTKHVKMPKRPFIKPGVEEIVNGPAAERIFDGVLQKFNRQGGWS